MPGDPYSPPCYAFSGGNGGSTYQGVTDKEILVTVRTLEGPSAAEIFADISGEQVSDSPEAYRNTAYALAEYFSTRFQMYGRKIKLVEFRGEGSGASELLGGGKEKALSDAVRASKELGAFADISAITIPYADALAQQKVVNIGSPYPSREWFVTRRPVLVEPVPRRHQRGGVERHRVRRRGSHRARRPTTPARRIKGKTRVYGDRGAREPGVPGVGERLHPQGARPPASRSP